MCNLLDQLKITKRLKKTQEIHEIKALFMLLWYTYKMVNFVKQCITKSTFVKLLRSMQYNFISLQTQILKKVDNAS